jgi:hypothetical protein
MKTTDAELPSSQHTSSKLGSLVVYLLCFCRLGFFCGVVLGHMCSLSLVNPCVLPSYVVTEHGPARVLSSGMQQAVGIIPPVNLNFFLVI